MNPQADFQIRNVVVEGRRTRFSVFRRRRNWAASS